MQLLFVWMVLSCFSDDFFLSFFAVVFCFSIFKRKATMLQLYTKQFRRVFPSSVGVVFAAVQFAFETL